MAQLGAATVLLGHRHLLYVACLFVCGRLSCTAAKQNSSNRPIIKGFNTKLAPPLSSHIWILLAWSHQGCPSSLPLLICVWCLPMASLRMRCHAPQQLCSPSCSFTPAAVARPARLGRAQLCRGANHQQQGALMPRQCSRRSAVVVKAISAGVCGTPRVVWHTGLCCASWATQSTSPCHLISCMCQETAPSTVVVTAAAAGEGMAPQLKSAIDTLIQSNKVVVFMKVSSCGTPGGG